MALCMTEITSDRLNGVCYVNLFCVSNDFSSNNLRLLFVCGGVLPCQPLNQQPAFLLSILVMCSLGNQPQSLHLLCVANHQPSASQFPWYATLLCCNIKFCDRTANIQLPSVQHCRFDNFGSFAPSGPHVITFSSCSCRCFLRLPIVAVFVFVSASSLSSFTSWPSWS
ncbi:Uncharacterized protein APZ42_014904 [Daphnia magna]|uniref:Uncharacterized protein n=1 Tax=Daphnia magna TaxID=35525 RepID=A0A162NZX9_9CRUS|nr:Uncharacterized protein APZ42_014904 [Daphnia magna]